MSKRDWYIIGVQLLAEVGPAGLTIEALCQRAGVTKGSFYHHFGSMEGYKRSLLTFYEEEGTLDIIAQLAAVPTPQAKLRALVEIVVASSSQPTGHGELVLRAWAFQDELVREVQQRIDGRRLAYVQALIQEILADEATAVTHAHLMYAILVGAEQMHPPLMGEPLLAMFNIYLQLLGIEPL